MRETRAFLVRSKGCINSNGVIAVWEGCGVGGTGVWRLGKGRVDMEKHAPGRSICPLRNGFGASTDKRGALVLGVKAFCVDRHAW